MSPELALVDAALAAELRALERPLMHVATTKPAGLEHDEAAVEPVEFTIVAPSFQDDENDPIADLIVQRHEAHVAEPPAPDIYEHDPTADELAPIAELHDPTADLIVQETDQQAETSGYPALPAPVHDGPEPLDATEAALREIRDRLASPTPTRRGRRFRRRFIVASGLSTALALGVVAANVGFGVTQLPV